AENVRLFLCAVTACQIAFVRHVKRNRIGSHHFRPQNTPSPCVSKIKLKILRHKRCLPHQTAQQFAFRGRPSVQRTNRNEICSLRRHAIPLSMNRIPDSGILKFVWRGLLPLVGALPKRELFSIFHFSQSVNTTPTALCPFSAPASIRTT